VLLREGFLPGSFYLNADHDEVGSEIGLNNFHVFLKFPSLRVEEQLPFAVQSVFFQMSQ
jgi:hypothetical protein